MIEAIRKHGVLLTAAGANVLRFTPPLIVSESEIDTVLERIDAFFAELG
jgi:acetylornithine/N-succinyldiaminopimelate aminotransferase